MHQLTKLAEDTNPDPGSRREALLAERARIDRQLEELGRGIVETLPSERALERGREVIALADEPAADFRRVRDDFDQLNRKLRSDLLNNEGSHGQVLELLFAGMDLIGETQAGHQSWRALRHRSAHRGASGPAARADHLLGCGKPEHGNRAARLRRCRRVHAFGSRGLMDEETSLAHRELWVQEPTPCRVESPEGLTVGELTVYEGLRANRWGERVRLEQERIAWPAALEAVPNALGPHL